MTPSSAPAARVQSAIAALIVLCLAVFVLTSQGAPPEQAKTTPAKKNDVDAPAILALIAKLGAESYEQRETAHKRLAAIGEPAMELLAKAAKENADAEVRERAQRLITDIEQLRFPAIFSVRALDREARRLAVTADGTGFVACGDAGVGRGVFKTGTPVVQFGSERANWCIALSADGKRALVGGDDHLARFYDLETGQRLQVLVGHGGPSGAPRFCPMANAR